MRFCGACAFLLLISRVAVGQELTSGISVVGYGIAKARPAVVEISATISGEAELAVDAGVKIRDARQRAIDAFEKMNNLSVAIESKGFVVNPAIDATMLAQGRAIQQVVVNGNLVLQETRPADLARRTSMIEQVKVVLKDADKLELPKLTETVTKLIDAGRANGLQYAQTSTMTSSYQVTTTPIPPAPMVLYRIPDTTAVRGIAYKAAVEDARKRAAQLAEISGVKLGKILAVSDQDAMGRQNLPSPGGSVPGSQLTVDPDGGVSSTVFGEIPISVRLAVQFEMIK